MSRSGVRFSSRAPKTVGIARVLEGFTTQQLYCDRVTVQNLLQIYSVRSSCGGSASRRNWCSGRHSEAHRVGWWVAPDDRRCGASCAGQGGGIDGGHGFRACAGPGRRDRWWVRGGVTQRFSRGWAPGPVRQDAAGVTLWSRRRSVLSWKVPLPSVPAPRRAVRPCPTHQGANRPSPLNRHVRFRPVRIVPNRRSLRCSSGCQRPPGGRRFRVPVRNITGTQNPPPAPLRSSVLGRCASSPAGRGRWRPPNMASTTTW